MCEGPEAGTVPGMLGDIKERVVGPRAWWVGEQMRSENGWGRAQTVQGLASHCEGLGFCSERSREPPQGFQQRSDGIRFAF